MTMEEIETEHNAALASLSAAQRRALNRLASARQQTNFNGKTPNENLRALFAKEAQDQLV